MLKILFCCSYSERGFPWWLSGKEPACNAGDVGSIPGWEDSLWRREWLPTPVFLPGGFHGQRSLVGYSPWGCKESDTTKVTEHTQTHAQGGNQADFITFSEEVKKCTCTRNKRNVEMNHKGNKVIFFPSSWGRGW